MSTGDLPKYRSTFAWDSPYGHVVRLFDKLGVRPGIVLDLGCGTGPIAEPLSERGFKYVGLDLDPASLDALGSRGFATSRIDLSEHQNLVNSLPDLVASERVAAVLLLDVLEHIPGTRAFLRSLQEALLHLSRPLLALSLPNIGHADVGAKLAFGRFDYTPTGLLDDTHVSFFTERRMSAELRRLGWMEVAADDLVLHDSDQHFPALHPALAPKAPLAGLLAHWRNQVDACSRVNQFVRVFSLGEVEASLGEPAESVPPPFLSVVMRTIGHRNDTLRDALTCLAAQTVDDFEVKLIVHSDEKSAEDLRNLVDEFHPTFSSRVEVRQVRGGCRGRPLNVGLESASGEYVAFLDDDDMVSGDWVEVFLEASRESPGQLLRSLTVNQYTEMTQPANPSALPYRPRSSAQNVYEPKFDLVTHLHVNQTPICSIAVPRTGIEAFNLRFDETLPVTEDWEFLLRAAQVMGVRDTGRITSLYRRWICGEGSDGVVPGTVWDSVRITILHRLDAAPLLLPAGSTGKLLAAREAAQLADDARRRELEATRAALHRTEQELAAARHEAEAAREVAHGFERSRVWRATFPLRWSLYQARRLAARMRPGKDGANR
jgi:SAM-dependent methyltransferase